MSTIGDKVEQAIAPQVAAMEEDFRRTVASEFGQRRIRNRIKGKVVPRLRNTFKSRVTVDADGWGLIRFRTTRYAYILHYGHDSMQVTRKSKSHSTTYTKGHLRKSGFINDVSNRNLPGIANVAAKIMGDVAVRDMLPTPKVL